MPRKRMLSEEAVPDLVAWYYSPRTVRDKAAELGISPDTLMDYVKGRHKQKGSKVDIDELAESISRQSAGIHVERSTGRGDE